MSEEAFLVKQNQRYCNRNAGVCNIKNRTEEYKTGTIPEPVRIVAFDHGEVEHIYDFSMKQG